MAGFKTDVDVANRVAQHLGEPRISSSYASLALAVAATTPTRLALEVNALYDKRRIYQLTRNLWTCATRKAVLRPIDTSTMLWTPDIYAAGTTYGFGAIVIDSNGIWWQSQISTNLAHTPSINTEYWNQYFGPDYMTPFVADSSTLSSPAAPMISISTSGGALAAQTYYVVITYLGPSGETIASSESTATATASHLLKVTSPAAATGATKYNVYASNTTGTETLQSLSPVTIGVDWTEPTTGLILGRSPPDPISPGFANSSFPAISFSAGEMTAFNGAAYLSLTNNNIDIPPTPNWISLGGTLTNLRIIYPIGTSPASLPGRNVFRKPHGFLRQAPTDPKAGTNAWLGQPTGNWQEDWVFEGGYITSQMNVPLTIRFVCDMSDINTLNEMFLEMLALDMAIMLNKMFTQDIPKGNDLKADFRVLASEARVVNAIEVGPVTPDMDTWLMARY